MRLRKLALIPLSTSVVFHLIFFSSSASFGWSGNFTINEIGDRQYTSGVYSSKGQDLHSLAVGCTEGLFQVKVLSNVGPLETLDMRVRFDAKKVKFWEVQESPSRGGLYSLDFLEPERFFSDLKKSKSVAIQFYTYSGAILTTKFDIAGATKMAGKLKKAGCIL